MTLVNCGIPPNPHLNFTSTTRLVMDVTIGHFHTTTHHFKPNTIKTMESTKHHKYTTHYQSQRLAFASMVANTLGHFGPDLPQFLWNLVDHHAQLTYDFSIDTAVHLSTEQEMDYRKLRGLKYHENQLRLLTCRFKAVTLPVFGATFNLTSSPAYHRWLDLTRQNLLPIPNPITPVSHSPAPSFSTLLTPHSQSQHQATTANLPSTTHPSPITQTSAPHSLIHHLRHLQSRNPLFHSLLANLDKPS
jgi:hypothetical protein